MAGIKIRDLYYKVTSRPEILPGAMRSALMDAGIFVCSQTNLLKGEVFATLTPGKSRLTIPMPPDQDLNRVDKVFYRDPTDSTGQWSEVKELAPIYLESQRLHVESHEQAAPAFWGLRGGTLFLQAPSDGTYPLRISYSWSPTRESLPEVFNLPREAEDALVAYARKVLLKDIDPKASQEAKKEFDGHLSDLRAMGETGESGTRSIFDFLPSEG